MTTSPNAAASLDVPARALAPSLAASALSCSISRDENMTSCPALTHTAPSVPPTWPEPTMPIFILRPFCGRAGRGRLAAIKPAAAVATKARRFERTGFISGLSGNSFCLTLEHQHERGEHQSGAREHRGGDGFVEKKPAPQDAEDRDGEAHGERARGADVAHEAEERQIGETAAEEAERELGRGRFRGP